MNIVDRELRNETENAGNAQKSVLVGEIMTTNVFTLHEDATLQALNEVMKWKSIRHVPVVDDESVLVGLVTHRDLLKLSISSLADINPTEQELINRGIRIGNIMNEEVVSVAADVPLYEAAKLMYRKKYGCLPVTHNRKLVGIITEADFVKFFVEWEIDRAP